MCPFFHQGKDNPAKILGAGDVPALEHSPGQHAPAKQGELAEAFR